MEQIKMKMNIHQIIWYTIIFSIIGLIIETLFGFFTMGILESRKGLIWGPFCPVYGVGATLLILILSQYQDKPLKLFVYGSILGNIIEYLLSYFLEAMYGTRFWDYAFISGNLNGRICFNYSLFWGILAVCLIKFITPWIDKLIDKIPTSKRKLINSIVVILLAIDALATVWAVKAYQERVTIQYYQLEQHKAEGIKEQIETTLFSNEIMLKTFPNLRYMDKEGKQYFIRDIIKAKE